MMITTGATWDVITNRLRGEIIIEGLFRELRGPWFMLTYIVKEYAAATNLIMLRGRSISLEVIVEHVINMISAIRLQEGGAAIFAADIKNHIIDIVGIIMFNPLFMRSLREFDE